MQFVLVNSEMRQSEQPGMGLEIFFSGQKHFITADRLQILNLLLSTYEAAIQRNKELSLARKNSMRSTQSSKPPTRNWKRSVTPCPTICARRCARSRDSWNCCGRTPGPRFQKKISGYLATISQSAKRMGNLIDDLLAFSRVRHAEMQKTDVDLDAMVQETFRDFEAETKERISCGKSTRCHPCGRSRLAAHGAGQSDFQCGEVHRRSHQDQHRNQWCFQTEAARQ